MKATLFHRCYDETGEAATWLREKEVFLWVDIDTSTVHSYKPGTEVFTDFRLPAPVSAIIPWKEHPEEVVLAMKDRLVAFHVDEGSFRTLLQLEGMPQAWRTNDAKASPEGRLWLGIMNGAGHHRETGWVFAVESDFSCRKLLINQHIPNGVVWNAAGNKLYYADSGRGCIEEYVYRPEEGTVHFRRVAIHVPPEYGVPDGMTLSADGLLWVAHWGGFGVYIWDPVSGELVDKIELPVPNVASCTFGGKGEKQLFITTARSGLSEEEKAAYPLSGSLFVASTKAFAAENHYPFIGG